MCHFFIFNYKFQSVLNYLNPLLVPTSRTHLNFVQSDMFSREGLVTNYILASPWLLQGAKTGKRNRFFQD